MLKIPHCAMHKNLILLFLLVVTSIFASAQNTLIQTDVDKHFNSAYELYQKEQFASARLGFERYLAQAGLTDINKKIESEYYISFCGMRLQNADAIDNLNNFSTKYPYHPMATWCNYELADYYFNKKELRKVIVFFEKADPELLNEDQNLERNFKLGYAYFNEKKFAKAGEFFDKIKDREHKYTYATNYYAGYVYYRLGEYDSALMSLHRAEENEAFKYLVPAMVANVYNKQQKYDTVITYTEKILKDNPDIGSFDELTLLLAEAYYKKNKFKESLIHFKKYIAKIDKDLRADINYRIGYCFYYNNDNPNAIEYFKKINSLNDTIGQYSSYYLGMAYVKLNNKPFAFSALEQAGLMPFDEKIQEEAVFNSGKVKFDLERFSEAIVILKGYTKTYSKAKYTAESNELIAEAYLHSKNFMEAIAYIEALKVKTARVLGAYQRVTYLKGVELYNNDKYPEALAMFQKSIKEKVDKNTALACHFYSGEIYAIGKRNADAIESYANVFKIQNAELHPLYYKARYGIGYAYFNLKKYDDASRHFKAYVENQNPNLDPETYSDALIRLADCYYVGKHYDDALKVYDKATTYARTDVDYVLFQKGLMYEFEDKVAEAKTVYEDLMAKYPNASYYDDALYHKALLDFEKSGSYAAAIAGFTSVINLKTPSLYLPEALKRRALANSNLKNFPEAIDDFNRIVTDYPTYFESPVDILESLHSCLVSANRENEFEEIYAKFKNANPKNDKFADLEYKNAETLFTKQKYPPAIKAFQDFIATYPTSLSVSDAYFYIGEANFRSNDKIEALKAFEQVIQDGKSNFRTKSLNRTGDIEFELKSYKEAIRHYDALLNVAGNSKRDKFNAKKGKMECYYELGILDTALIFANDIITEGGAPVYITNKANLYLGKIPYMKGDFEAAEDFLISAANSAKDSSGAEAQYLLASISYKQQKYKQSLETLFELTDKFKMFDRWVLRSLLLVADNYLALEEVFQAKTTLNSIVSKSKDEEMVRLASAKLDEIIAKESQGVNPESK